jgi:hypothetical protein
MNKLIAGEKGMNPPIFLLNPGIIDPQPRLTQQGFDNCLFKRLCLEDEPVFHIFPSGSTMTQTFELPEIHVPYLF